MVARDILFSAVLNRAALFSPPTLWVLLLLNMLEVVVVDTSRVVDN
jgi:hypothetical protein